MTKTEYDKLMRMLGRLTRIRHYANVVGDARSVETLTTLLLPFEKISVNQVGDHASKLAVSLEIGGSATTGVRGDALDNLKRSLDEHGRSYTTGTRKEASAQAFLIPVEAVARSMNALNESKVYRTFLERERSKDEARIAQKAKSQAQGAEAMAATWREADARQGRALAEENKRLRALGLETKPIPKGLEVDAEGELVRPPVVESSEESIEHQSSSVGESSEEGSRKGQQSVKVDFNRPSEVGPSPASSNSPDVLDKRDGTLYFPPGTVAPPNSDPLLGSILVNNIPLHRYFSSPKDREAVLRPFIVSRTTGAFNVFALVKNGGTTGQAEALALAIGRGIAVHQPMAKQALAKCSSPSLSLSLPLPSFPVLTSSFSLLVYRGSASRSSTGRAKEDRSPEGPKGQHLGQALRASVCKMVLLVGATGGTCTFGSSVMPMRVPSSLALVDETCAREGSDQHDIVFVGSEDFTVRRPVFGPAGECQTTLFLRSGPPEASSPVRTRRHGRRDSPSVEGKSGGMVARVSSASRLVEECAAEENARRLRLLLPRFRG